MKMIKLIINFVGTEYEIFMSYKERRGGQNILVPKFFSYFKKYILTFEPMK